MKTRLITFIEIFLVVSLVFSTSFAEAQEKDVKNSEACLGDFNNDNFVGFPDYVLFAKNFNQKVNETNEMYDIAEDDNKLIDFADFVKFNTIFGKECLKSEKPAAGIEKEINGSLKIDYVLNIVKNNFESNQELEIYTLPGRNVHVSYDKELKINKVDGGEVVIAFINGTFKASNNDLVINYSKDNKTRLVEIRYSLINFSSITEVFVAANGDTYWKLNNYYNISNENFEEAFVNNHITTRSFELNKPLAETAAVEDCNANIEACFKTVSYVNDGNGRIAKIEDGKLNYYHGDIIGSVSKITDENGLIVYSADYLPFGELVEGSVIGDDRFKFAGKELDDESGLYYFGSRYYDPEVGRFTSVDPQEQFPDLYSYAKNNPITYVDPDGEIVWAMAIGGAIGAVGDIYSQMQGGRSWSQIDWWEVGGAGLMGVMTSIPLSSVFKVLTVGSKIVKGAQSTEKITSFSRTVEKVNKATKGLGDKVDEFVGERRFTKPLGVLGELPGMEKLGKTAGRVLSKTSPGPTRNAAKATSQISKAVEKSRQIQGEINSLNSQKRLIQDQYKRQTTTLTSTAAKNNARRAVDAQTKHFDRKIKDKLVQKEGILVE